MRVAVLSDIHGNAPALEAVLGDMESEGLDAVVVGGDVAAGPLPRDTLDLLRGIGDRARFVRGNADRYMVESFEGRARRGATVGDEWFARQIGPKDRDFLAAFETTVELEIEGLGRTLFCHGSPRGDEEIITLLTPASRLEPMMAEITERVVVCGHTHTPFDRVVGTLRIVNPGSVGMPYAERPGAYWAVLGPGVELRCTHYDLDAAAARIRASEWPGAEGFVAENLLTVPSGQDAARYFERLATEPRTGDE